MIKLMDLELINTSTVQSTLASGIKTGKTAPVLKIGQTAQNTRASTKKESNTAMAVSLLQTEVFSQDNLQLTKYQVSVNTFGRIKRHTWVNG